jgi:hypothetical protein
MGRFIPGRAHDHGIGLTLNPDGQGLLLDEIKLYGGSDCAFLALGRYVNSVSAQGFPFSDEITR